MFLSGFDNEEDQVHENNTRTPEKYRFRIIQNSIVRLRFS
jgi:hypothetical protein